MTEPRNVPFDLDGESQIVPRSGTNPAELAQLGERAEHLVVVRESNESDTVLMTGMIQQTLASRPELPSIATIQDLGIRPLLEPEGLPQDVHLVQLRHGGATAVLFSHAGVYYLYSMASAAKANAQGENDFSELFVSVLFSLRPVHVYVASLTRLVRSFEHGALVQHAVQRHVEVVFAGDTKLEMRGANASQGHIMWSTLSLIAAAERTSIVQRLTAGLVAKYRRGEWLPGCHSEPIGYALDSSKHLVPDASQVKLARLAWSLLADADLTLADVLRQLARAGVSTRLARERYGDHATVADLAEPTGYLKRILHNGSLYLTGEHTIPHANPFPGVTDLAGAPIHYSDEHPDGRLLFRYELGRLNIEPELIHTALRLREATIRPARTGAAARRTAPPLNGLQWSQGGDDFWLRGTHGGLYEIRARRSK